MIHIDARGVTELGDYFARFPAATAEAMSIALNETARGAAIDAVRREMYAEVAFPQGYLDDTRLKFTRPATPTRLEAVITGRDRPTSLARFAPAGIPVSRGAAQGGGVGVSVTVKPGSPRFVPGAFLFTLKNQNIGFAIRLKPGQQVRGVTRRQPVVLFRNKAGEPVVYLLYGPSVDQVMTDVSLKVKPEVTSALDAEFTRQLARLLKVLP